MQRWPDDDTELPRTGHARHRFPVVPGVILVFLSGLVASAPTHHGQPAPESGLGIGGLGHCCVPNNGSPGCNDPACEQAVCQDDPFCCQTDWDGQCADRAVTNCSGLCTDGENDCCISKGTPGCSVPTCEETVCGMDERCCRGSWDFVCAERAWELCEDVCKLVGDCAIDFIITLDDYAGFLQCVTGANGGPVEGHCQCADLDGDRDADAVDWGMLQTLLSQ